MSTPAEHRLTMELEETLEKDASGEFKQKLHDDFAKQISQIDSRLKKGVPPDEYERLNTLKQGLQSADVVLERVWLYHHRR